jgi:hypothetical protein
MHVGSADASSPYTTAWDRGGLTRSNKSQLKAFRFADPQSALFYLYLPSQVRANSLAPPSPFDTYWAHPPLVVALSITSGPDAKKGAKRASVSRKKKAFFGYAWAKSNNMVGQRPIELQELSKYFNMPEKAVAKTLGICLTSLKKLARQNGITRWPYRKVTDAHFRAAPGSLCLCSHLSLSLGSPMHLLPRGQKSSRAGPGRNFAFICWHLQARLLFSALLYAALPRPGLTSATCLQIKSLDKKLRKLEVAMSTAKDDPSMVYAKWGDNDSASSYSSTSPTPVSDDASMASTPRQAHDSSPSPSSRLSPVSRPGGGSSMEMASQGTSFCSPVPVRVQNVVTSCKAGEPVKLELSLSHSMLQSVACGMDNITFVMHGGEARCADSSNEAASSGTFASSLMSASAPLQETAPVPAVKIEPGVESSALSTISELSDEEIIAMLAQCAGSESRSRAAPQVPDTTASLHEAAQALSDVEIMQALAGCCEVPHSFSYDHDNNEAHQLPRLLSSELQTTSVTCLPSLVLALEKCENRLKPHLTIIVFLLVSQWAFRPCNQIQGLLSSSRTPTTTTSTHSTTTYSPATDRQITSLT